MDHVEPDVALCPGTSAFAEELFRACCSGRAIWLMSYRPEVM